jgi:hypothetical protein
MYGVSKAAVAGFVFFVSTMAGVILAAPMIGLGSPTVAILGASLIGIFVTVPTVALIMIIGLKPRDAGQVHMPPQPPAQHTQHTHYHTTNNTMNVYVSRRGMTPFDQCTEVAHTLQVSRHMAERLIESGEVKLIEPPTWG